MPSPPRRQPLPASDFKMFRNWCIVRAVVARQTADLANRSTTPAAALAHGELNTWTVVLAKLFNVDERDVYAWLTEAETGSLEVAVDHLSRKLGVSAKDRELGC